MKEKEMMQIFTGLGSRVEAELNRSRRCLFSGLLALSLFLSLFIIVRFNVAAGYRTIVVPDDFSTIQAAINNATPGDTIFVHQGIYHENIVVNKSISIIGENKNETIIDGGGLGSVVIVSEIHVKISGFTLRNSGTGWPKSGIQIVNSYVNTFSDNIIQDNHIGILVDSSPGNAIWGNNITANHYGIYVLKSWMNKISNNVILYNWAGVVFGSSYENAFEGNLVKGSDNVGVSLSYSYDNNMHYNSFIDNAYQVSVYPEDYINVWDAGYPQGGNFWNDYSGPDLYSGPYQNETGSDGVIDDPYIINLHNKDRYPRLREVVVFHDVAVKSVTPSASKVYEGQILDIYVVVANTGNYTETFNAFVYYDDAIIDTQVVNNLAESTELALTFSWNTTGVKSDMNYTISAEVSEVLGEVNLDNNILVGGVVRVRSHALWAIKIVEVVPSEESGQPVSGFEKGTMAHFKVTINNTSPESEIILVTVNVYDVSNATLGVVSFQGPIMPGISVFILGFPIPSASDTGIAMVHANAFTDWPHLGGLPYGPELSATFQIIGP